MTWKISSLVLAIPLLAFNFGCSGTPEPSVTGDCSSGSIEYQGVCRKRCSIAANCGSSSLDCYTVFIAGSGSAGICGVKCPNGSEIDWSQSAFCSDVDECSEGLDECDPVAECNNNVISLYSSPGKAPYECACPFGTTDMNDDGTECRTDEPDTVGSEVACGTTNDNDHDLDGIDGMLSRAILVNLDTGDDAYGGAGNAALCGTSVAHPCQTISQALQQTIKYHRDHIYVAKSPTLTLGDAYKETIVLRRGLHIFGGFESNFAQRNPGSTTLVVGGFGGPALVVDYRPGVGTNPVGTYTVDGFTLVSLWPEATPPDAGKSSIAVIVEDGLGPAGDTQLANSAVVEFRNVVISADIGVQGANGAAGAAGRPGCSGAGGSSDADNDNTYFSCSNPACVCLTSVSRGFGGAGGSSEQNSSAEAAKGHDGGTADGSGGGGGAAGRIGANTPLSPGGSGGPAPDAARPAFPTPLSKPLGVLSLETSSLSPFYSWTPAVGSAGDAGNSGGQGSGGGGSGGDNQANCNIFGCNPDRNDGAQGGMGGLGGQAGSGGSGGQGGGSSIGILGVNAAIGLVCVSVATSDAGDGGAGGNGGKGGDFGGGGPGGPEKTTDGTTTAAGGSGGNGGAGSGGNGGQGGRGGSSVGALKANNTILTLGTSTFFEHGNAGNGGQGGNPGLGGSGHTNNGYQPSQEQAGAATNQLTFP